MNRIDLAKLLLVSGHENVSDALYKQENVDIKLENRADVKDEMDSLLNLLKNRFIPEWLPMQAELDLTMAGADAYKTLISNNGKRINYGYCLASERNELQDCFPWKHWKDINGAVDMENIKTELIDKLHFLPAIINVLMEALCTQDDDDNDAIETMVKQIEEIKWIDRNETRFLEFMVGSRVLLSFHEENKLELEAEDIIVKYMLTVSELDLEFIGFFHAMHSVKRYEKNQTASLRNIIAGIDWSQTKSKAILFAQLESYVSTAIYTYALVFDMTIEKAYEDMWEKYLIKNVLNLYRIKNGYKEGTYIKVFDGVEDNTIINEIATTLSIDNRPLVKDELYSAYDARYQELYKLEKIKISKMVKENRY